MNQQRSRRFKAAKERKEKEQKEEEIRKQLMSEGREVPPKTEAIVCFSPSLYSLLPSLPLSVVVVTFYASLIRTLLRRELHSWPR